MKEISIFKVLQNFINLCNLSKEDLYCMSYGPIRFSNYILNPFWKKRK